jgi:hypothetical protein
MIRRPTTRRPAATLLEVLIGLGIMGVAVTSIISLFPFAALTVAKALRDDRGTTAAVYADGLIRDVHKRYVVEPGSAASAEPYHLAMDNPAGAGSGGVAGLTALTGTETTPSYPTYVDPMGLAAGRGQLGDNNGTVLAQIPRVNFGFVNTSGASSGLSLRVASLLDNLNFDTDGTTPPANAPDMRELRYNVAWMLQRPSNRDRYTVRQQVVVYDRRVHLFAPAGSEATFTATQYPLDSSTGAPNNLITGVPYTVTVNGTPVAVEIRRGTWVLDAGYPQGIPSATPPQPPLLQAEFYRVVSVTDTGTNYTLEVHKPIVRSDGLTGSYTANLVVLPAVADVFERPLLTAGTGP